MGRSTSKSSSLLEIGADHLLLEEAENADEATLERKICFPEDDRLFFLAADFAPWSNNRTTPREN